AQGHDLTGWTLNLASAISADGRTIVGLGRNPAGQLEAWVARLGPASGPAVSFGCANNAVCLHDLVTGRGPRWLVGPAGARWPFRPMASDWLREALTAPAWCGT